MIQDTTLRMVVQAVDQASVPLENVKQRLDDVDGGLDSVKKTAAESLPAIGKNAGELADEFDDLGRSAESAGTFMGPGMAELIAVGVIAVVALTKRVVEAIDKHREIADLAQRLDLPYRTVDDYSEAWAKVAISLNDAARGYKALGDAQAAALKGLGLSPGNLGELDRVRKLVAVGEGTRQEKIDVFRRLFGMSYEDAAKELDSTINKFYAQVARSGYNPAVTGAQPTVDGITAGSLNVSQLLNSGRLPSPEQFKDMQGDQRAAESAIREINASVEREKEKSRRAAEVSDRAAARAALERQREEFDKHVVFLHEGTKIEEAEQKALAKVVEQNNRDIARSSNEAWRTINEQTTAAIRELEFPVNQFAEAWKNSMKEMVYYGDFSFKRLVARIIVELSSRKLFEAIDRVGDAIGNALDRGGGGGGILKGIGSFIGSIFGGNAGGGQESGLRWVGEEGPELVASGPNAMRVYNMRQLAAGVGGGQGGGTVHYHDNRTYNVSGIETQQVIGYFERTRREDQRANLRMLERNGLGSMR